MPAGTIPKEPVDTSRFASSRMFATAARTGFEHLLRHRCPKDQRVLLPAYIGLSPNEGSGVHDPIEAAGVRYAMYRVDDQLTVDMADLERALDDGSVFAVFVIHYFGFPQPQLLAIRSLCDARGVALIEDCAHCCGSRLGEVPLGSVGDASLFSIHKILPTDTGGFLQLNDSTQLPPLAEADVASGGAVAAYCNANWEAIAERRRQNYEHLARLVEQIENITVMTPELADGVVPLNLPVLIDGADRFAVYTALREQNIEAVALYHTLIDEIGADEFPVSHSVSRRILNLPIHQDVEPDALGPIADALSRAVSEN